MDSRLWYENVVINCANFDWISGVTIAPFSPRVHYCLRWMSLQRTRHVLAWRVEVYLFFWRPEIARRYCFASIGGLWECLTAVLAGHADSNCYQNGNCWPQPSEAEKKREEIRLGKQPIRQEYVPIRTKDKSDQVVDTHKTTLLTLVRKDPVLDEILLAIKGGSIWAQKKMIE